jgi:hypothetical protein
MTTLAVLALLLLTHASAPAQAPDLTGQWTGKLTRTAPDGRTQAIDFMFDLTHEGKTLTGTVGPNAARMWPIEKGAVVDGRLKGQMLAALDGQSFTTEVDAGRATSN